MKPTLKTILFASALGVACSSNAQNEFKKEWETKVAVENKWNSCNADLSLILIGDLKAFAMVDGTSGKTLWTFNAKERLGVKSVEDWTFLWAKEGEPVEVVYQKPREDARLTMYLDPRTGAVNSTLTEATLKDKAGKAKRRKSRQVFALSAFDEASGTYVDLSFRDKLLKNSGAGNTFDVTVNASGGYSWATAIKARAVTHINRLLLSSDEPDIMIDVMVKSGKVFVIYEGITVIDLKTGQVLWNTTFDLVDAGMTSQEIGKAPLPVVDGEAVYLCDFSKGEKAIKKLDIHTGALLWKGDKLDNNDVVSQLEIVDHVLLAKFGGMIRKAKAVYNANNGATTQIAKNVYEGRSDLRAYDAGSGRQLWTAETTMTDDKFSRSECSMMTDAGMVIACTAKHIYYLDPASGKVRQKTELGKEIGRPQTIFEYNNHYIVKGDEGIASFSPDGSRNYAVNTNKVLFTEFRGDAFVVWTGKDADDMNEFIRFDLSDGKIYGKQKGCYSPRFDQSGDYFIRFNNETVTRYKTL